MKVCSIYNYYDKEKTSIAYLVYFEDERNFYIEICDNAEMNNVPMMFALFMKKSIYSLDSNWSKKWVCSRIIPTDRQNLGQILKENHMKYYDEYTLLMKSKGICSHDDFAVEEIPQKRISINHRYVDEHMENFVVMPGGYELNCNDVGYVHHF